jgi:DNA-binding NarL/FixJ family response regulator
MVVDDHPMWRDAVARDLGEAGLDVVATAPDGVAAVRIATAVRPEVVVMDLHLPELSGVEATRRIVAALPATRVLVLSASGEAGGVLEAVKAGATGYLLKSAGAGELLGAVRRTAAGEATFTAGLAGLLLGEYRRIATEPAAGDPPRLTDRETEVLRLVAKGLTAKQVAARLGLSHRTVQNHVQNAMGKLQVRNRAGLVRYAIEAGLDDD